VLSFSHPLLYTGQVSIVLSQFYTYICMHVYDVCAYLYGIHLYVYVNVLEMLECTSIMYVYVCIVYY